MLPLALPAAEVEIGTVEEIDYLLVKRYDRRLISSSAEPLCLERLHQEDFCQALGIVSETKYENEGGPSLKKCFALLREVSEAPVIDLQRLLDAAIFNFFIGNHDAHGKNFSFLYAAGPPVGRLAPFYDVLSTSFYPELSPKMAMKIGGEYVADKVRPRHFEHLAEEAGLAQPMVRRRVPELAETILSKIQEASAIHPEKSGPVAVFIRERCQNLMRNFI